MGCTEGSISKGESGDEGGYNRIFVHRGTALGASKGNAHFVGLDPWPGRCRRIPS